MSAPKYSVGDRVAYAQLNGCLDIIETRLGTVIAVRDGMIEIAPSGDLPDRTSWMFASAEAVKKIS